MLLPAGSMVDGRPLMFLNDLDIDSDGIIYLSDSTKYQRREFIYSTLECIGDGRCDVFIAIILFIYFRMK